MRTIFHVDVNSAFLSWEAVYRLHHLGGTVDLREQVSAVGGDMAMRHGIILAKSIPAKKYGIKRGKRYWKRGRNVLSFFWYRPITTCTKSVPPLFWKS